MTVVQRLERLSVEAPSGCREWTGARNRLGYGRIMVDRKAQLAHRVAWEVANGSIPDGLLVLHRCDNPPCILIAHLFLGDHAANMADMMAKGRSARGSRGERSGKAKLSESDVSLLRERYAAGEARDVIAADLGVHPGTVTNIARGFRRRYDGPTSEGLIAVPIPGRIDRQRAVTLYEGGMTTAEVAAELGTASGNISRVLRSAGVRMRRGRDARSTLARARGLTL